MQEDEISLIDLWRVIIQRRLAIGKATIELSITETKNATGNAMKTKERFLMLLWISVRVRLPLVNGQVYTFC